jgi:hypothetical protein
MAPISSDATKVCSIKVGFISSTRNFTFNIMFLSTLTSPNKKYEMTVNVRFRNVYISAVIILQYEIKPSYLFEMKTSHK